ncbi:MAG: crotonase/enoyl-CoA hydratase family protein [Pseudomonadota bacterium]
MLVTTDIQDNLATVTLNRAEKKNALNFEMLSALEETCDALSRAKAVRAIIITGAGESFSAGIDTSMMMAMAGDLDGLKARMVDVDATGANEFQRPMTCWSALHVPVIAAIEGHCFGAGMQLALGADFRIAAPDARLSIMEAKWGLIPDMGISQFLPALLPADRAKLLIMTGEELSGAEALRLGLVTETSESPLERARALGKLLAVKSPEAVRDAKKLVNAAWPSAGVQGLAREAAYQSALMGSPNQIEAISANLQKRAPDFA